MRLATVLAVLAAAVTPATLTHPRRAAPLHSATATPRPTLARASRGEPRAPLHVNAAHAMSQRRRIPRPHLAGRGRPARGGALNWNALAGCESSGDWHANTGNGYYGGLQFSLSTWRSFGGHGLPSQASRVEQIRVAERVLAVQGLRAWPSCTAQLGWR